MAETREELERWIAALVAELLDIPPESIDPSARLDRYGLDSASALSVVDELERHLGRELDPALIVDFPTIRALAEHLVAR